MKSSITEKGPSSAAKKRNLPAMSRMTTVTPKYYKLIFGLPISSLKNSSAKQSVDISRIPNQDFSVTFNSLLTRIQIQNHRLVEYLSSKK